jgi:hypothetical protein
MPVVAVAIPIVPGKTDEWRTFVDELNGPRRAEFVESRQRAGVQERTFLQQTPMGDLVIVTLDGDDPMTAYMEMMSATDEFTTWFIERATALHGIDLSTMRSAPPPELVIDTAQVAAPVG